MDLSNYVRVAMYDLPEPTRTAAPAGNLLAQEASGVTYNWDTNTLFVVGDGGTSVTQVSLTGQLIDTMTLASGSSPQGTEFYDTEGITYVGGGKFVFTEERWRQAVEFTYAPGTTLTRGDTHTVDLGTDVGNVGNEDLSWDPSTGGFIFVKEKDPEGIFQTNIDFVAGTATNGSSTTVNPTNLFDPTHVGTTDLSGVYAMSNSAAFVGTPQESHLLVLSQESGKIVEIGRDGTVYSTLDLVAPSTSTGIDLAAMTVEGITMDNQGRIYLVSEEGGGDFNHPQLWVYELPVSTPNTAPTAVSLSNPLASILENTSTAARIKVADIAITDDGQGTNTIMLTGADAAKFEADSTGLYLKAGTVLDYETQKTYAVTVNVDDTTIGNTPDVSTNYTLKVGNIVNEGAAGSVAITEVAPWESSSPSGADWFELTNTGTTAIDLAGWKMDDNSYSFSSAVAMGGVSSLAAGQSAIFVEGTAATAQAFINTWFGGTAPAGVQVGYYSGSGVGLGTGGDAVNVFDSSGTLKASVTFGASPSGPSLPTFDNSAQLNSTSLTTHVTISTLSAVGTNGAFTASGDANEIGSPGSAGGVPAPVNQAPTAIGLTGEITTLADDTSTATHVKVASIIVNDDGLGTNTLSLSGADASFFEVDSTGLYIKAGVDLDAATKAHYDVTVNVDDTTVGSTPDASVSFALDLTSAATVRITEVAPWSSGNSPVGADWFELTNTGGSAVNITGWTMDDSSFSVATSVALNGVTSIGAGQSVIFVEGTAATAQAFINTWFGGTAPAGVQVGYYSGGGVGLSTGGDGVVVYDATGNQQAKVSFGSSPAGPAFPTFDNSAGLDNVTLTQLSTAGVNGAYHPATDANETGSPGTTVNASPVNQAPTAVNLIGAITSLSDQTSTATHVKVADIGISDDGLGTNTLSLSGADASFFEVDSTGLYIKAGVDLDAAAKAHYAVTVNVDDTTVGGTPDASVNFALDLTAAATSVRITEVAPWSSSNSPFQADWFELTNTGSTAVNLSGWKVDDSSFSLASALALNGVSSIGAGQSVIFVEGTAATAQGFINTWFGGTAPAGVQVGYYSGSGVGLSTGGDGVIVYDASGTQQAKVSFGSSPAGPAFATFDNSAGLDNVTLTQLSVAGTNGAYHPAADANETGSPGTTVNAAPVNAAPTAVNLANTITTLADDTITTTHVKVADISISDDGLGTNSLSLSGADASFFEVDATGLYIKAGVDLDAVAKSHYAVTVNVDDTTVGGTPDASVNFALDLTDAATVRITEVAPWSSSNSPFQADWFELTNTGSTAVDLTGWKVDDSSFSLASALALNGVSSIGVGQSVIFVEGTAATAQAFINTWFGGTAPAGVQVGYYSGSGIGLSTGGDGVIVYDASGTQQAKVSFGSSPAGPAFATFDNSAGLDNVTLTQLSVAGTNGAYHPATDANETGSPGTTHNPPNVAPVATNDIGSALSEDNVLAAVGNVITNDSDADNNALTIAGARAGTETAGGSLTSVAGATIVHGAYGDLTINVDGSYSYALANGSAAVQALNSGEHVSDIFTYQATDGHGGTDTAELSFDIVGKDEGILGTAANDTLNGTVDADILRGYAGNDKLNGGDGDDVLDGGLGADTLAGGTGVDTASYAHATSGVAVDLQTGKGTYGEATGDKLTLIENLTGSNYADVLEGNGKANVIHGGGGDDLIIGNAGIDQLFGDGGDDAFVVSGTVMGSIDGGDGFDTIRLDHDNAVLRWGDFHNIELISGDGYANVTIAGATGDDTIDLTGVALTDIVAINAGQGADTVLGSISDDHINGLGGNDTLSGGAGDDFITGGAGIDILSGGTGADHFIFAKADMGKTIDTADTVLDFVSHSGDVIDLSGIDAINGAGDDAFTFIGQGAFTKAAGQLHYEVSGSDSYVSGDYNGDGKADFIIKLAGVTSLSVDDFIL